MIHSSLLFFQKRKILDFILPVDVLVDFSLPPHNQNESA